MKKQILAMGGGGFSMEPENLKLDRYLLSLSDKSRPKVCFVGTASGDSEEYIKRFYNSMKTLNCEPSHLSLYKPPKGDLESFVFKKDIFYVGGGSTKNLLALWREWGLDSVLTEAYNRGIIMAGISAGSICWFEQGVTDSLPNELSSIDCLGILKGSNCPHYDGESGRRGAYHKLQQKGLIGGVACDDGVAGHYINGDLSKFVSSRKSAKAYNVSLIDGKILEDIILPEFLENP